MENHSKEWYIENKERFKKIVENIVDDFFDTIENSAPVQRENGEYEIITWTNNIDEIQDQFSKFVRESDSSSLEAAEEKA